MNHNYLKFTGKFAELKKMGYTFQKLYASNYMSWSKNGVFIFKKGLDITHCEINLYMLVKLLQGDSKFKRYDAIPGSITFFVFYDDDNTYEYREYSEENERLYFENMDEWRNHNSETDKAPRQIYTKNVGSELLEQLKELDRLGWYELATTDEDN